MQENKSNILIYQTENGVAKIETRLLEETVWLSQAQMATLFEKGRVTITEHINNIFKEGKLNENSVSRKFRHTTVQEKAYLNFNYGKFPEKLLSKMKSKNVNPDSSVFYPSETN